MDSGRRHHKGAEGLVGDVVIGLTCLVWGLGGLLMTIVPTMGLAWVKRSFLDPWWRFWIAHATLLMGLVLIIGTTGLQGSWLWVACGGIAVAKACLALGSSASFRERVLHRVGTWPVWLHRCNGMLSLVFAVLLASDVILHG